MARQTKKQKAEEAARKDKEKRTIALRGKVDGKEMTFVLQRIKDDAMGNYEMIKVFGTGEYKEDAQYFIQTSNEENGWNFTVKNDVGEVLMADAVKADAMEAMHKAWRDNYSLEQAEGFIDSKISQLRRMADDLERRKPQIREAVENVSNTHPVSIFEWACNDIDNLSRNLDLGGTATRIAGGLAIAFGQN